MGEVVKQYGLEFPAEWSQTLIELDCLAHQHSVEKGGLGMHGHLKKSMQLLWPHLYAGEVEPGIPRWRDEIEQLTLAFCTQRNVAVIGHAAAAKTHTFGHVAAACYFADMHNTIITLTSTHLGGLRKRLWADTVSACQTSTLGQVVEVRNHDMTIRPCGSKEDKYVIEGIATDRGQEAVEKIQGNHSKIHRYVIIDEAQGTPPAIFAAAANLMTDQDFRMAMLANPTKHFSEFGTWCEPVNGWGTIDPEIDFVWKTKRGGLCVRLDGLRSPNIVHGRAVFPFLLRQDYIDSVILSFGKDSPRYWTFVRGWFAPDGAAGIVIPTSLITRAEQPLDFRFKPHRIAALDPAFDGGDQCALAIGEYDEEYRINLVDMVPVKVTVSSTSDPLDHLIARETVRLCKDVYKIESPADFIGDATGAGRGVLSIIQVEWGREIERCQFGSAVTERTLKAGDPTPCVELFDRYVTELWWAARAWFEEGMVGGILEKFKLLRQDLSAREYETVREKKIAVEKKSDMKARIGRSPDDGDAFVMLVELVRRKGGRAGSKTKQVGGSFLTRLIHRAVKSSNLVAHEYGQAL